MNILNIQCSLRSEGSLSRRLSQCFLEGLDNSGQPYSIKQRDLGINPPSLINSEWVKSVFSKTRRTPEQEELLIESDEYINELAWADLIVIGTPMYNYGMPAHLKAWFDNVIRIGKTFSFDLSRGDFPLEPLLSGKILTLFTSSGEFGFEEGGIRGPLNHLSTHIKTCSYYLGVDTTKDFYHVGIEYEEFKDERHVKSINQGIEMATSLARTVSDKYFIHSGKVATGEIHSATPFTIQ